MATLAELRQRVSDRLIDPNNTAVSPARVTASINDALSYYARKEFHFNRAQSNTTLTVGNPVIPLPVDFYQEVLPNTFVLYDGNTRFPLEKVNPTEYDNINIVDTNGIPTIYKYDTGVFKCFPYPDRAFIVTVSYIKSYPVLVNDTDTNDFTVYGDKLLMYDALSRLSAELRQDDKMEAYYSGRAKDEYKSLIAQTNYRNVSNSHQVYY